MCGVIGAKINSQDSEVKPFIQRLFYESKIRGLHAFGFSFFDGEKITTKKFRSFEKCVEEIPGEFKSLIGHCRYSTSGDYLTELNNQPIEDQNTALAYNGVITMADKKEYEIENGRHYKTGNDGEIFLDKYIRNDQWESFVFNGLFSFAGLVLGSNGSLVALRNQRRPLYVGKERGNTYFASTKDIFNRAGFSGTVQEIPAGALTVG
jgi:glutamine phosphoribosylpyrophosphate amidotransferase